MYSSNLYEAYQEELIQAERTRKLMDRFDIKTAKGLDIETLVVLDALLQTKIAFYNPNLEGIVPADKFLVPWRDLYEELGCYFKLREHIGPIEQEWAIHYQTASSELLKKLRHDVNEANEHEHVGQLKLWKALTGLDTIGVLSSKNDDLPKAKDFDSLPYKQFSKEIQKLHQSTISDNLDSLSYTKVARMAVATVRQVPILRCAIAEDMFSLGSNLKNPVDPIIEQLQDIFSDLEMSDGHVVTRGKPIEWLWQQVEKLIDEFELQSNQQNR